MTGRKKPMTIDEFVLKWEVYASMAAKMRVDLGEMLKAAKLEGVDLCEARVNSVIESRLPKEDQF